MTEQWKRVQASLVIAVCLFLSVGCSTYLMEGRLHGDIATWYSQHVAFMETMAPRNLTNGAALRELSLFLALSEARQRLYMKSFWDVRETWTRDAYEERMGHIRYLCRLENRRAAWRTDRGRILLLCGFPFEVITYHDGIPAFIDEDLGDALSGEWVQRWVYQWDRKLVFYNFLYAQPHIWRLIPALSIDSGQQGFEDYWRSAFAPTRTGWEYLFRLVF